MRISVIYPIVMPPSEFEIVKVVLLKEVKDPVMFEVINVEV